MDIVGVVHVNAELELLAAACDFFRRIGIGADIIGIKVNSRAVLEVLLAKLLSSSMFLFLKHKEL